MRAFLRLLRPLWPLLGLRWTIPAVLVALGLLAALSEGLSISLLVPLIAGKTSAGGTGFLGWMAGLFQNLPEAWRVPAAAGCILAGVILKNLLCYSYSLLFNWVNTGIGHKLRSAILSQVLEVGQEFLDSQQAGRLVNILGTETWRVATALSLLSDMVINLCMASIFGILLFALSWKLAFAALVFFAVVTAATRLVTARIQRLGREAVAANTSFAHRMMETFNGLRIIRLFGNEKWEQDRFDQASSKVRTTFFRLDTISQAVHPLSEILTALFLAVIMITSANSQTEFAGLLAFLVLLYRLQTRVKALDGQRAALQGMTASVEEVASLLSREGKPYLSKGTATLEGIAPGIRFDNVSLAYHARPDPALDQVSFLIPAGKSTALVGASGAGKSSIASLVVRLYDPTGGRVLVGATDLKDLDLEWWRCRIAVVSQDVHLFDATLEENIAYGKPGVTREEIMEAARKAYVLEFASKLPEGFSTRLGEKGVRLSGGQKQRIALARAFVRNPEILILDEATNALDLASERLVQDAIDAMAADKTVLIIAHRISTIENADQVVVLDAGHVVEIGTPTALASAGGPFSKLHALQFQSRGQEVSGSEVQD